MSASTLRAAAALIRQRADAASDVWDDVAPFARPGHAFEVHLQSWSPTVALDAARLFDAAAKVGPAHGGILWDATVTLARTYLGDQS